MVELAFKSGASCALPMLSELSFLPDQEKDFGGDLLVMMVGCGIRGGDNGGLSGRLNGCSQVGCK